MSACAYGIFIRALSKVINMSSVCERFIFCFACRSSEVERGKKEAERRKKGERRNYIFTNLGLRLSKQSVISNFELLSTN